MPVRTSKTNENILNSLGTIALLLLSGNIYFIKHALDRLDALESITWNLRQEIAVLHATLKNQGRSFDSFFELPGENTSSYRHLASFQDNISLLEKVLLEERKEIL